jgi:hypothetical protein
MKHIIEDDNGFTPEMAWQALEIPPRDESFLWSALKYEDEEVAMYLLTLPGAEGNFRVDRQAERGLTLLH